jgi:lipoprotein-anchoring transpeptidase ErfK/SrfK
MKSRKLSNALALCLLIGVPGACYSEVYFAGWVQSEDDISRHESQGSSEPTRYNNDTGHFKKTKTKYHRHAEFTEFSNLPNTIATPGEKVVIVDPRVHAWGAYAANGKLIRSGLATAGASWCSDIGRPCRTKTGTFRIYSLGDSDCVSSKYPIDEGGGAPMPYCMYFNGSQGLHGSYNVVAGNASHGCVRMRVSDAEWLRFNFVNVGTKVIIKPY